MYSRVFKGKKISISNINYRKLLKRFDPDGFVLMPANRFRHAAMVNDTPCALCDTFRIVTSRDRSYIIETSCGKCPLTVFEENHDGCAMILKQVIHRRIICMDMEQVKYRPSYAARAVPELKVIMNILRSFKKE